jgi:pimeloyl-ACP methyl ester carboxylesterase/DNA-binding CsgD family transcriptional regulator
LQRFTLFGMSQGGSIAIAFALRHPEMVSRLVLAGAYARGALQRDPDATKRLEAETLLNLIRLGWGRDNSAFRQVFTNRFIPGASAEQQRWWTDLERTSASPEMAARTLEAFYRINVDDLARQLDVPTLVLHSRGDVAVPFDEGRRLAALIPGARFVPLQSDNHVLLGSEPAWGRFIEEVRSFLHAGEEAAPACGEALTPAERDVLHLMAQGLDNQAIADRLGKSEKTVRNQVSSILDKLEVHTRAAAIVRAIGLPGSS